MLSRRKLIIAGLLASCALATPGQAQTAPGATATTQTPSAAGGQQDGSQDIVVTAQKRDERLLDVPVAVTAVTAGALVARNLVQVRDFYATVPGLSYAGGSGQTTLALRGITTSIAGNPTVGVTVDDVPFGSSSALGYGGRLSPDLDPSTLDRIEVLRGPQGTLYGASSLGGLLKYVTAMPSTTEWSGRVEAGASFVDHGSEGWTTRGSVNAPLVADHVGLSVSGFYRRDPGYIDNVTTGNSDWNKARAHGGRAALLIKPVEAVTILLSALVQTLDGKGSPNIEVSPTYVPLAGQLATAASQGDDPYTTKSRLYTGRISADLGFGELTSITAYGENRYKASPDQTVRFAGLFEAFGLEGNRAVLANAFRTDKFSQEVRLASTGGGALQWLVGGFYTKEKTAGAQTLDALNPTSGALVQRLLTADFPSHLEEMAGFADLTYKVTDKFDIQIGGRYSHNKQDYVEVDTGALAGDPIPLSRSSDTSFTWLVTPRYKFSDDMMAYVRVASGYRPGGPNSNVGNIPRSYDPDTTINYELGLKGKALNRLVTYTASLFWIDWKDIQLAQTDPATQFLYFANGSGARSRGAEVELSIRPWQGMTLAGNAAYTDAKLTGGLLGSETPGQQVGNRGDRLPYAAKFAANLSADQDFDLGNGLTASLGGSMSYLGKRLGTFASTPDAPRGVAPAFTTFDLRSGVEYHGIRYSLYVRNITDKRGYTSAELRQAGNLAGGYNLSTIQPRTFGGTLAVSF